MGALKPEDKPTTLHEWINPLGTAERRQPILGSLVDFLTTTGLGREV